MVDLANHTHPLFKKDPSNPDTRLWRTARSFKAFWNVSKVGPTHCRCRGISLQRASTMGKRAYL